MKKYHLKQIDTDVYYDVTDEEFEAQVQEIWSAEQYGYFRPKDGVFIDLGANVGMATLYFHHILKAKEIHAIEPNPNIYKMLVKNVGHLPGVRTYNLAWANGNGVTQMLSDKNTHPQTLFQEGNVVNSISVQCSTPLTFFRKADVGHVDVLKIDTEGAEYIIFPDNGFGKISKNIDKIIGEAHYIRAGGFPEIIPEILKEWGYKTTFPKLKNHNFLRKFGYMDLQTKETKYYSYESDTIFIAEK